MNILVTGGAGYIGSHAARMLLNNGHNVFVIDNLSRGHLTAIKALKLENRFLKACISDRAAIKAAHSKLPIDVVMHFAAFAEVGESVREPSKYLQNNYHNSVKMLETLLELGVKKFIFSSTAATFGNPSLKSIPITENAPQLPINPYGESKLLLEKKLEELRLSQNFGYCILRYFNVAGASPDSLIGEDHNPETHLIPNILLSLLGSGKVFKVFGNNYPTPDGTCVRDYVHVEDLALAHMLCLNVLSEGKAHVYNLGSEQGFSVLEVLMACEKVTGQKIPYKIVEPRPGDPPILVASSAKIRAELGWSPKYPDLESIIEHAWKWHLKRTKGN